MAVTPYQNIQNLQELEALLLKEKVLLVYFSSDNCTVCKVLKPKIAHLAEEYFPQMALVSVNVSLAPEVAANNRVFTIPTVVVFFAGKEYIRKSQSFSLDELKNEIGRIYLRMFPKNL